MSEITRIPEASCPSCGYHMDAASPEDDGDEAPGPGDVSVCFQCTEILIFDDEMHSHLAPPDHPARTTPELIEFRQRLQKFHANHNY